MKRYEASHIYTPSAPRQIQFACRYSQPYPDPSWEFGFWLDDRCLASLTGALTISGHVRQGFGPAGFELIPPTTRPYMLGLSADVPGPALATQAANPGSTHRLLVDAQGREILEDMEDGARRWGNGTVVKEAQNCPTCGKPFLLSMANGGEAHSLCLACGAKT